MTTGEFIFAVINKELKLANADISANDAFFNDNQTPKWFNRYSFKTVDDFMEWRSFSYQLMRKWKPFSSRIQRYEWFNWINLEYGLKYDFDYKLIPKYEKYKIQFKKNSSNSEEYLPLY